MVKIRNQEMCDIAISIINEYIDERLFKPCRLTNYEFENQSYARWAAYEIIERLNKEAERLPPHLTGSWREPMQPVDIISGFMDDMECYSIYNRGKKHERIFTVARNVANDIILLFL